MIKGTVRFTKPVCCALERGFKLNPGLVEQLEKVVGKEKLKIFSRILPNTDDMRFVPSEEMKTAYGQIAKREIERIGVESEKLSCGHSVRDHVQALNFIIKKLTVIVH